MKVLSFALALPQRNDLRKGKGDDESTNDEGSAESTAKPNPFDIYLKSDWGFRSDMFVGKVIALLVLILEQMLHVYAPLLYRAIFFVLMLFTMRSGGLHGGGDADMIEEEPSNQPRVLNQYRSFVDDRQARLGSINDIEKLESHGYEKHRYLSKAFIDQYQQLLDEFESAQTSRSKAKRKVASGSSHDRDDVAYDDEEELSSHRKARKRMLSSKAKVKTKRSEKRVSRVPEGGAGARGRAKASRAPADDSYDNRSDGNDGKDDSDGEDIGENEENDESESESGSFSERKQSSASSRRTRKRQRKKMK